MSIEKEVLKKLVKVAQNQQKIIHKLAQTAETQDITVEVNQVIKQMSNVAHGIHCLGATFSAAEQLVNATVKVPGAHPGDPGNQAIITALQAALGAAKGIPSANVKVILTFG